MLVNTDAPNDTCMPLSLPQTDICFFFCVTPNRVDCAHACSLGVFCRRVLWWTANSSSVFAVKFGRIGYVTCGSGGHRMRQTVIPPVARSPKYQTPRHARHSDRTLKNVRHTNSNNFDHEASLLVNIRRISTRMSALVRLLTCRPRRGVLDPLLTHLSIVRESVAQKVDGESGGKQSKA